MSEQHTGATDQPFRPLSLDDLFALDLPEQEYVVDEILPTDSAGLLSGREKSGKGLLALDLCACVALGEPFLDRAVKEGPAIYCAAEEHVRDVRIRVAQRIGTRRDAPLYILPLDGSTPDRLQLDDAASLQRLWDMVEDLSPRLIVLDTLRELHSLQEDKSDEMGPLLRPVRQLAHQTGTTVLVNHHQNKQGGFRGSTAIRAAFDLEWAFSRLDETDLAGDPRGTLKVEGRHGPRSIIHLRLGSNLHWDLDGATITGRDMGGRERILTYLDKVNIAQTADEITAGIGLKRKTVQNLLAEMQKEVPLPFAVSGKGTKNDPRRFRTLSPRFDGFMDDEMIPPDPPSYRGGVRGNHFPGQEGEAGNDRWTA
jgi:RecA-family ATPase